MYSMEELKSWWEVPAIAHFFSLFKSCFMLTDFTIEELEEALLTDAEDDKSTIFTSKLLTELLQGCYDNPNISVTTYHDALIDIMKKRWEDEDGRVNPLSHMNADFHSLPTRLKVQIIHRLTEYRLDAKDVADKLSGLNPRDLRLEPLGTDRNGAKYWYFFGIRLYRETPPGKLIKKRKRENREKKKYMKKAKLANGRKSFETINISEAHSDDDDSGHNTDYRSIFDRFLNNVSQHKKKKLKKKRKHKRQKEESASGYRFIGLSDSKWEVVCYNIGDWKSLASSLEHSSSSKEDALRLLIIENFLPNLPKIVDDMEQQKLHKLQLELPRRSSCRLLAKKLYEEEEDGESSGKRGEKIKQERKAREEQRSQEEDARLVIDFEVMLRAELERKRKEGVAAWKKKAEEQRRMRIIDGLPLESDLSSDEAIQPLELNSNPQVERVGSKSVSREKSNKNGNDVDSTNVKRKGRKPTAVKNPGKTKTSGGNRRSSAQSRKSDDRDAIENGIYQRVAGDIEYDAMMETWVLLDDHPEAWPFQKPVEDWYAPGYHDIIKRPMDLSSIETKLKERKYVKVIEFRDDITLMFNNCRLYNGPDNEYTQVADELDKLFCNSLIASLSTKKNVVKKQISRKRSQSSDKHNAKPASKSKTKAEIVDESLGFGDDEDNDEDEGSSSSSSDEFTPPGMSKAQVKKQRLEVAKSLGVIKDKPSGRGQKVAAGRGRRISSSREATRRASSDVAKKSPTDTDEDEQPAARPPVKRRVSAARGKSRGVGKGATRGRRPSVTTRNNTSKSDESEHEKPKRQPVRRKPRGGARRGRASVQQQRSATSTRSESSSSSGSDDTDTASVKDAAAVPNASSTALENTDSLSTDTEKENDGEEAVASPLPADVTDNTDVEPGVKPRDESPPPDGDSSSSSSRASSRSPSLEKFEKMQEDAKSQPQVMWSLDFLASQARVLEEQDRKNEASSSSSTKTDTLRRISSDPFRKGSAQVSAAAPSENLKSSRSKSILSSGENHRKESLLSNRPSEVGDKRSGSAGVRSAPRSTGRGAESDPYNFNDDASPAHPILAKALDKSDVSETTFTSVESRSHVVDKATAQVMSPRGVASPHSHSEDQSSPLAALQRKTSTAVSQLVGPRVVSPNTNPSPVSLRHSAASGTPPDMEREQRTSARNPHVPSPHSSSASLPGSLPVRRESHGAYTNPVHRHVPASPDMPVHSTNQLRAAAVPMATQPPRTDMPSGVPPASIAASPVPKALASSLTSANPPRRTYHDRPTTDPQPTTANQPRSPSLSPALKSSSSVSAASPAPKTPSSLPNTATSHSTTPSSYHHPPASNPPSLDSAARRHSQPTIQPSPPTSIKSPPAWNRQPPTATSFAGNRSESSDALHGLQNKRPEQVVQRSRPVVSGIQTQTSSDSLHNAPPQNRGRSYPHASTKPNHPEPQRRPEAPSATSFDHRGPSRSMDSGYRNSSSTSQQQQQNPYGYGASPASTSTARRSSVTSASSRENTPSYSHDLPHTSSSTPLVSQHPNLASFGLTPWALQQTQASGQANGHPTHSSTESRQNAQRKQSSASATNNYGSNKGMQGQNIQQPPPQQRASAQQHHAMTPGTSHTQQHNPQHQGNQPAAPKHRNSTSEVPPGSATSGSKHRNNNNVASSSGAGQSARRQSNTPNVQQYAKSHADYMGYHIHPTASTTPLGGRDSRTPVYSPHQQNGLLSAAGANNNAALLHQDLHASATLRALHQQHKPDRSSHAAASMLQYAAATQGAVAAVAASEQYNRLAATAHHRGTSQHPLAGVYHPHQNVATTSPHQAAAHLSSPWLQAAAAAPAAGYPSNLLAAPHMDPAVYHLMQQSGMHGQYQMYTNPVMQQLHQQHLQHHMLPKY